MPSPSHVPVLLDRVVALLAPALDHDGAVLVDCTLGLGGHSEAVLERIADGPGDRHRPRPAGAGARERAGWRRSATGSPACTRCTTSSPDVLDVARPGRRSTPCCSTWASPRCSSTSASAGSPTPRTRRWTCGWTAPPGSTAADVLNTYDAARPDPGAARVRRGEVRPQDRRRRRAGARARSRSRRSGRLVELLYAEIPAPARRTGGHPAKRTFQALRMEVNDELAVLRRAIPAAIDAIAVGGRVVVESYHSLEDRLVKQAFVAATRIDVPEDMPFVPEGHEPALRLVTRGSGEGQARTRSRRTRAPPRSGCVRSNACETGEQQHEQLRLIRRSGRADRRGSREDRGRAGPAHRRTAPAYAGPPGCRSSRWSRWCCSAASSGCCCSTPPCSRRRSRRPRWSGQATTLAAREQMLRWSSTGCATRSGSPATAQRLGMVQACTPAFLKLGTGEVIGAAVRRRPRWRVPDLAGAAGAAGGARPAAERRRGDRAAASRRRRADPATRPAEPPGTPAETVGRTKRTSSTQQHQTPEPALRPESPLRQRPARPRGVPPGIPAAAAARRASW